MPCLPPPHLSGPSNLHHPLHHPSLPVGEAPEQCSSQPPDASLTLLSSSRGNLGASSPPSPDEGCRSVKGIGSASAPPID